MNSRRGSPAVPSGSDPLAADRLRPWLLGSLVAALVSVSFVPTETVFHGGGLLLVMLLIWGIAVAWSAAGALQGSLRIAWSPVFLGWLAFLAWQGISLASSWSTGNPRAGWNVFWLWASLGTAFLLLVQFLRTAVERRALVVVMLGLAVSLCVVGYYQYFVEFPRTRALYVKNPDDVLRQAGVDAPPGSPQRRLFEDRLNSTEPLATFALTNSFAGFLSPWLLVSLGILAMGWGEKGGHRPRWILLAMLLCMLGCWWLTKSRTAWLATVCGGGLLILYGRRVGWRPDWRLPAALVALSVVAGLFAVLSGGLDRLVVLESSKSAAYRLQYWRATSALIREAPWFGCGPGNFQQYYTRYKLPEASETIAEPHNFVLEIWATTGTPGMLALLAILAGGFWHVAQASRQRDQEPHSPDEQASERAEKKLKDRSRPVTLPDGGSPRAVYWGALAGAVVGYLVCGVLEGYFPSPALLAIGFPLSAVLVVGLHGWVADGRLPTMVLVAAITALLINLLAAGGISFAAVAVTVWILFALLVAPAAIPVAEAGGVAGVRPWYAGPPGQYLIAGMLGLGLFGYYWTTYGPITESRTALSQGDLAVRMGRIPDAKESYERAAVLDPWGTEPWERLTELSHATWMRSGAAADEQAFRLTLAELLRRNPHSAHARTLAGHQWLSAYRRFESPAALHEAIGCYEVAVSLYPNYNLGHAQLAWALHLAGDPRSVTERDEARRLNGLNPHAEQQLSRQRLFDPRAGEGRPAGGGETAEQWLDEIRN